MTCASNSGTSGQWYRSTSAQFRPGRREYPLGPDEPHPLRHHGRRRDGLLVPLRGYQQLRQYDESNQAYGRLKDATLNFSAIGESTYTGYNVLGDSADDLPDSIPSQIGYLLAEWSGYNAVTVENSAADGESTTYFYTSGAATAALTGAVAAAVSNGSGYVQIMIGVNDTGVNSAATYRAQLLGICQTYNASSIKCIVHYPYMLPTDGVNSWTPATVELMESYYAEIDSIIDGDNILAGDKSTALPHGAEHHGVPCRPTTSTRICSGPSAVRAAGPGILADTEPPRRRRPDQLRVLRLPMFDAALLDAILFDAGPFAPPAPTATSSVDPYRSTLTRAGRTRGAARLGSSSRRAAPTRDAGQSPWCPRPAAAPTRDDRRSAMSNPASVEQGVTGTFVVQLVDGQGNAYTQYAGTEDLAGSVRIGQDFPALFQPTLAWISGPLGTISVEVLGTSTAALDIGRYWLELHLADDSADLYEGWLEVTYAVGTAAALVRYGSYQAMLDLAPAIEKFQRASDLAGFASQQNAARRWFEDLLHRHHKSNDGLSTDYTVGWVGYGWGGPCRSTAVGWRDGRRSQWLTTQLAAGALVVSDQVVEAVSCYAVALLYDRQAMAVSDGATYAAIARKFFARPTTSRRTSRPSSSRRTRRHGGS